MDLVVLLDLGSSPDFAVFELCELQPDEYFLCTLLSSPSVDYNSAYLVVLL